MEMFTKVQFS